MENIIKVMVFKEKKYKDRDSLFQDKNTPFEVKEINNTLDDLYKNINCTNIDIAQRLIGGRMYCIICDDEGCYRDGVVYTAVCPENPYADIPGHIVVTGPADRNGDLTSITNEDVSNIISHISLTTQKAPEKVIVPVIILD